MPVGWFIAPYKRSLLDPEPSRYCAMQDADAIIALDDGGWQEAECLGDRAIVRVRASITTLADLATVYKRLPKDALATPLSDLTLAQKKALRDEMASMGYTAQEIQNKFGADLGAYTLGDVVRFILTRRLKPRYDAATDSIILDGPIQVCRDVAEVVNRCFSDADWLRLKNLRDSLMAEWDANKKTIRLSQHLSTTNLPKWELDALLPLLARQGYFFDRIRPDTFPTTGVLDNFNRADEGPPPSANWTTGISGGTTGEQVVSNTIRHSSSSGCSSYWNPGTFGPDSEAYLTLTTLGVANDTTRLFTRLQQIGAGTVDGYRIMHTQLAATDTIVIARGDNNVWTQIGTTINQDLAAGDTLGKDAVSSTITAYYKTGGSWASLGSATDATYGSAGYIAIGGNGITARYDDFGGGTVTVAAGLPFHQELIQQAVNRAATY